MLKDNAILEMTQRKINLLDQAIADSECTQRALQEFELEDGVAIVDKVNQSHHPLYLLLFGLRGLTIQARRS